MCLYAYNIRRVQILIPRETHRRGNLQFDQDVNNTHGRTNLEQTHKIRKNFIEKYTKREIQVAR